MSEKVEKIKGDIKKIEASIKVYSKKNDATSKKIIQSFKSKLDVFEKELQKAEKEEQSALKKIKIRATSKKVADLKKLISSKKYAIYKNSDVDLEKDAARPALPIGKRKSKITGNTYYEYRANRIDVKQPAKRYPKLEHGGELETMSEKEFLQKYWGANVFTEDVSKHFDIKKMSSSNDAKIEKFLEELKKDGYSIKKKSYSDFTSVMGVKKMNKLEHGGYMAKGGEVENLEKELRKLQRELNSGRLRTYREGDKSEEEMNRQKERAEKMARFYEVLKLFREKDNKMAKGGGIDGQKIAKPSGWRWKNSAVTDGIISESSLYKTPSERMRKMYPDYVDFENRPTKSDKNPSKKFISLETGGQMAKGGGFNQYGEPYGFEEDNSDSVYEIHHKPEMNEKNPFLIWDKIDGVYIAEFPNRQRAIHYIDNKFETGGQMAHGGEIKYEVDDVVYNKVHNTVGIVRMAEERGEVKTDADGNVDVDDLEYYNPIKHKAHGLADIAPSTKKEIEERGLWKPFSKHTSKMAKGGGIEDIDMNEVESSAIFYTDESKWTPKPTIKKFADEIAEKEKLKKMLDNKEITPSKIIGTGYKSQYARPLAYRWLNERILIARRAIEILQERGHTYANGGELHRLQQ
jgi:hypothetical protein